MKINFLSLGNRAQRYLFTLLVWNNLVGLFLSLALQQRSSLGFWKLYFLVLVVSHTTALICLVAIDIFELFISRFCDSPLPFYLVAIIPTAAVLVPGLMAGFFMSNQVAQFLAMDWHPSFSMIWKPGLLFGAIVTLFNVMHAARVYRLQLQFQRERELAYAKTCLLEARLDLLSKELNPHLLFNLIQSVLCLLHQDPKKAERMLENIAVFYQKVLLIFEKNSIPLEEELQLIRTYAQLNEERLSNFTLDINEANAKQFASFQLPPMILQPLIENAIKHALAPLPKESPKCIFIDLEKSLDSLLIKITDNGQGIKNTKKSSPGFDVGIKNCRARIREFFGDGAHIKLESLGQGACVTLELPYETNK